MRFVGPCGRLDQPETTRTQSHLDYFVPEYFRQTPEELETMLVLAALQRSPCYAKAVA